MIARFQAPDRSSPFEWRYLGRAVGICAVFSTAMEFLILLAAPQRDYWIPYGIFAGAIFQLLLSIYAADLAYEAAPSRSRHPIIEGTIGVTFVMLTGLSLQFMVGLLNTGSASFAVAWSTHIIVLKISAACAAVFLITLLVRLRRGD